jgi:hypothetical protein
MYGLHNTHGEGVEVHQPTCSVTDNNNPAPKTAISRGSGNAVVAAGSPTVLTLSAGMRVKPEVGDEIYCYGFVNSGNNGRFTVSAVTSTTISFTNASAGNETLALTETGNISIYHSPKKVYQDVAFTSGVPTSGSVVFGNTLTVTPLAGIYSYISAYNSTSTDLTIQVAGGSLVCPAGSSLGHEIRPFTSNVVCDATTATLGKIIINIS